MLSYRCKSTDVEGITYHCSCKDGSDISLVIRMGNRYHCATCKVHCPLSSGHKEKGCLVPTEDELVRKFIHNDLSCDVSQEYLLNCLELGD